MGYIRRFLGFLSLGLLIFILAFPVLAVEIQDTSSEVPTEISSSQPSQGEDNSSLKDEIVIEIKQQNNEIISSEINVSTQTISAEDATGFKAVILGLIGDYTSITTDYTYTTYNGSTQHSISTEVDTPWIAAACIFGGVLYCIFRFLGGLFCGRK